MGSSTSSTVNQTSQKVRDVLLNSPINTKNRPSTNSQMSMSLPTLLEGRVLKPCLKKTNNTQNSSLPTLSRQALYQNVTQQGGTPPEDATTTSSPAVDIECESTCSSSSSSSSEGHVNTKKTSTTSAVATSTSEQAKSTESRKKKIQLTPILISSNNNQPSPTNRVQFVDMRRSGSFSSLTYTNYMNSQQDIFSESPKSSKHRDQNQTNHSPSSAPSPRRYSPSSSISSPRGSVTNISPRSSTITRKNLSINTTSPSTPTSQNSSPTHHVSNARLGGATPPNLASKQMSLYDMYNNNFKSQTKSDSFRNHKDFSSSKSDSKSMKNLYASRFGSIFNPSLNTSIHIPLLSVTQPDAPPSFIHYPKPSRSSQYLDVR